MGRNYSQLFRPKLLVLTWMEQSKTRGRAYKTFWVWDQVHAQAPDWSEFDSQNLTNLEFEHAFNLHMCQIVYALLKQWLKKYLSLKSFSNSKCLSRFWHHVVVCFRCVMSTEQTTMRGGEGMGRLCPQRSGPETEPLAPRSDNHLSGDFSRIYLDNTVLATHCSLLGWS